MLFTPIRLLRIAGIADGVSLLVLLLIAMPLKYAADLPMAVTIVGSLHGGIFCIYVLTIIYAAIRIRWNILWSIAAFLVAFIPIGNFILDRNLAKIEHRY